MINFDEELKKYKPALEVDDLQEKVGGSDVKDILEILQYLSTKVGAPEEDKTDA
ncbi:MAG: hypothetical protein FWC76_07255 [Defluviitaleaceae bacterium]|nr:hypothetical protein [Defluviitaleaceae bacterium]